ncbi:hypothetical protein [Streptomyces triticisoli]|uniref:hypothetical protein n=1 Tax=Streptomyces triticisoli TaxID=2182797 RepID=UPI000DDA4E65|nr:hypothetical protein [Streptomyces triticisoli]
MRGPRSGGVVLAAAGRGMRRTVARTLDDTAERWNKAVPRLVAMDSEGLREALLTAARHPGSDDGRP